MQFLHEIYYFAKCENATQNVGDFNHPSAGVSFKVSRVQVPGILKVLRVQEEECCSKCRACELTDSEDPDNLKGGDLREVSATGKTTLM